MTSVLIPLASMTPMPIPALMTAEVVTAEIDFSQQLLSLMGSLEAESDGEATTGIAGQQSSETPEQDEKKEELPAAPVLISTFTCFLPARLPAGFGLPSAGDEPVDELVPVGAAPTADIVDMVDIEIEAPAPAPRIADAAATPNPKGELAFAVLLTEFAEPRESPSAAETIHVAHPQVFRAEPVRIDRDTQRLALAGAPTVNVVPQATVAMTVEPVPAIETTRISNETQRPAQQETSAPMPIEPAVTAEPTRGRFETHRLDVFDIPAVRETAQQQSSNTDSFLSDDKQPDRQPASSTPRLRQTTDFEPWSNSNQIETIEVAAPRETVSQIPSLAPIALAAAVSATAPCPPAAPVGVENVVEASPALRPDPTPVMQPSSRSELTEISITVPVSRPEAPGEERVAIHMVQKGTEIHVSVRTPDQDIAQTLREDLTRLARSLDEAGFRAETWRPAAAMVAGLASTNTHRDMAQETPNRNTTGDDGRSNGNNGREQGEQRRRQQDDRPRWVAELEQYRN